MDDIEREALINIAYLYLKIPKDVVLQYLSKSEWKILADCYKLVDQINQRNLNF